MDLDAALVSAIHREGPEVLKRARGKGLRPDLVQGDSKEVYSFLVDHFIRFGDFPPPEIVEGKTGQALIQLPENVHADFLVDEVFNRCLYEKLRTGHEKFGEQLKDAPREPKKALVFLEEFLLELRKDQLAQSKVESLFSYGKDVWDHYEKMKRGETGILTPWKSVNESTRGFWPMDLVLFVARVGIGKTWTGVMLALEAWKQGKKVLFATTEVSRQRIAMRLFCILYKIPYSAYHNGILTGIRDEHGVPISGQEQVLYDGIQKMLEEQRLYVVGGNFDFRVESFSAALDEIKPDFVVLDGAYLLRVQGANRTEKAANAFDELKRLANRHELAMAVTHQFNREVKSNVASTVRTESIGLTDVAGWNADLIYGLIQTDDLKKDKKMRMKPLKVREGFGDEVELNWNFETMDFSEIGKVSGGDAEEFDTGTEDKGPHKAADDIPF